MKSKSGGLGGSRGAGSGEFKVGQVKAIHRAPAPDDRRVDVVMKGEGMSGKEKATIYMNHKLAKELKKDKKYEFELEKRAIDKDRGQGARYGKNRKAYRSDTIPAEVTREETFKGPGGGSSRKSKTAKWFHN